MKSQVLQNKIVILSCSELARQTDTNKGSWSRWFSGEFKPSTESLLKISKALNITVDEILCGIEERKFSQR